MRISRVISAFALALGLVLAGTPAGAARASANVIQSNCFWHVDYNNTAIRTGAGPSYPVVAYVNAGTVLPTGHTNPAMCTWGTGGNIYPPVCPLKPGSASFYWAKVSYGGVARWVYHSCLTMFFA